MSGGRPITISTPLGEGVLRFHRMTATEELARLFEFQVDLLSSDAEIAFDEVLGQNMTVALELPQGETRYFNGFVSRFRQIGRVKNDVCYQATLRPWLWFLTRTADCRIYQDQTVPAIVKDVFRRHGFTDFEELLSDSYTTLQYCVQYRETSFNFVSRLMEQEGIYYFFKHENGKHTLVLCDSYGSHQRNPGYEKMPYHPPTETGAQEDSICEWLITCEVQPGAFALRDFNFQKPKEDLGARSLIQRDHAGGDFEVYDYPGDYAEYGDGERYARVRIEELQAQHERLQGRSFARGLATGGLFELTGFPRADQNREYLIVSTTHELAAAEYESGAGPEGVAPCACRFLAVDSRQAYRAPRLTLKPLVQGPQTAIVVGKEGEEIWTDKYGRVKVRFHWDRQEKDPEDKPIPDEGRSCWIRVGQYWSGKKWGSLAVPRLGTEVIVEFLEGDPDRPLITGQVYNEACLPPYDPSGRATVTALKTNSSKGGGGFNELRFEDKKGEEQVFLHGEKNLDIRIKNDRFETVGHDRSLVVENDKREHVKNERHEEVGSHHYESIGGDLHLKVAGKEAVAIDKSLSVTVGEDVAEVFKGSHGHQVGGDYYVKAANIIIEAASNVTIKVGGSFIAIEAGGIKISSGGQVVAEAGATAKVKGAAGLNLESPAITVVKGSVVKIN
ncbi:MAG: type VI secretion system tip protein VgrG [Proteobacteria bacterium]|nr:type VI secretion system tip protein VgrG [Pseudomonadota bacterium]